VEPGDKAELTVVSVGLVVHGVQHLEAALDTSGIPQAILGRPRDDHLVADVGMDLPSGLEHRIGHIERDPIEEREETFRSEPLRGGRRSLEVDEQEHPLLDVELVVATGHQADERALAERSIELPDHVGGEGDREGDPDRQRGEIAAIANDRRPHDGRSEGEAKHDEDEIAERADPNNHGERLAPELAAPGAGVEYQVEGVDGHRNGEPGQGAPGNRGEVELALDHR
jgi:hypothetical protein